ncbi:MAG: hemolysin XhlA family protein [Clostridium sp.]
MEDKNLVKELNDRLIRIEVLLEQTVKNNDLKAEILEEKIKVANNRIRDLENSITWLWRAVVGGVIAGAIALLFK